MPGNGAISGRIHTDAGGGLLTGVLDGNATDININANIRELVAGADGALYFLARAPQAATPSLVQLKSGQLSVVAGGAPCQAAICGDHGPARSAGISAPGGLAIGQQNDLFISAGGIRRVGATFPVRGTPSLSIPSEDGGEVYLFDPSGHHLQTVDATTGTALYTMGYDPDGHLVGIRDRDGLQTTILRLPDGTATVIVGPYGQVTDLTVGSDGYLSRVEDAEGNHWDMTYTGGLIETFQNRNGHTSTMHYDTKGRLDHDADSVGGFINLVRTDHPGGMTVARTTALGRTWTNDASSASISINGLVVATDETHINTGPDGLQTGMSITGGSIITPGSPITINTPDGMKRVRQQLPDTRFGMKAPVDTITDTTPSALKRVVESTRQTVLSDPNDILSVVSRTDIAKINGRPWTSHYDVASNVETLASPAGRVTTTSFDGLGHVIEVDVPGILPVTFTYDGNGRLQSTVQGSRTTTTGYGADGRLESVTDPLGRTSSVTRDAVGRVKTATRPDLAFTSFGYDAEGNTTEVVPPGKPAHDFSFDARELPATYDPPVLASGPTDTAYSFDLDEQPTQVTQPGPRIVQYGYDAAGRPSTVTFPTGTITRSYDAKGRIGAIAGPTGVTTSYGYDGSLLTSIAWSGAVNGSVARTFDSDFRMATETVNGLFPVAFGYDADSLLVSAGDLTIARDPFNGLPVGTTAGIVSEARGYDSFGDVASSSFTANGAPLLSWQYTRDDLGRIATKTEVNGGVQHVFVYSYDTVGRLHEVTEDGTVVEHYEYDSNGNRTFSQNSEGTFSATVDEQDRLLSYGSLEFTYTPNGELATKTDSVTNETTRYTYDAVGNLREVVLPDGRDITYLVDGSGRRLTKLIDGANLRGWVWAGGLQPLGELDSGGNLVKRFVYAGIANVPSLIVTSGASYRLVKDHLGSVREVLDTATGAVAQKLEYDAWGRVLLDTNPGFQPFGFAGGLYDPDTGLVRFGSRDFDAELGRWVQKDTVGFSGGTTLLSSYAGDDPVNRSDATGFLDDQTFDYATRTIQQLYPAGSFLAPLAPVAIDAAPYALAVGGVSLAGYEGYELYNEWDSKSFWQYFFGGNTPGGSFGAPPQGILSDDDIAQYEIGECTAPPPPIDAGTPPDAGFKEPCDAVRENCRAETGGLGWDAYAICCAKRGCSG